MNTGHKTVVAMLAVVAVLLVVNIVQGPRAAEAQEVTGDGEPYVADVDVRVVSDTERNIYRIWSDGQVDVTNLYPYSGCVSDGPTVILAPADHGVPVIQGSVYVRAPAPDVWVVELFEDGRIDLAVSSRGDRCTVFGSGGTACLGDVDRNGETNFNDLLFVLNDWGECE